VVPKCLRAIVSSDRIKISAAPAPVTVTVAGDTLGKPAQALVLQEADYPPVTYIPRSDINMARLEKMAKSTNCPWKGNASYFALRTSSGLLENAAWSYEAPLPGCEAIRGYLAFYPDKVSLG